MRQILLAAAPAVAQDTRSVLTILTETGTTVAVCAIYLPVKGLDPSALIEGMGVAQTPAVADVIVSPATEAISF